MITDNYYITGYLLGFPATSVPSTVLPTGSTRFDVWEEKFTRYKAYVLLYVSRHTHVYNEGE